MSKMAPCTLPGMPGEIVDQIAGNLNDADLTALHSVSKVVYSQTKNAYAKRFFADVHVFMHPLSFEKLSFLSKDNFYSTMVKHVTISTYVLRDKSFRRKGACKSYQLCESIIKIYIIVHSFWSLAHGRDLHPQPWS